MDALVAAWCAGRGAVAETAKRDPAKLLLPPELEKRCKAVELKIKKRGARCRRQPRADQGVL